MIRIEIVLIATLFIMKTCGQCSTPGYGSIYPTYTDRYTCCYKFTNPTIPTYAAPVTGTNDFIVNTGNPIISYTGSALTQSAAGDGTLFYETGNNVYTTIYTDSNGNQKTPITVYYATGSNMWQRTLQNSDSRLTNTLTGRRGMLWFTANNGVFSCIRFNFTGSSTNVSPTTQAVAVGFNGTIAGCGTTTTTTYLLNATNPASVASPNVTIAYNATTNKMDVSVVAWYIPQFSTYSITFSDFDVNKDDINKTGTCENRVSSSYTGVSFSNWWTHVANAAVNNALGTINTLAYGPSGGWTLSMLDCSRVQWVRSLTMGQLQNCRNSSGGQEITVTDNSNSGGIIIYSGVLYVQLVSPIFTGYGSGNKVGYTSIEWSYPFNFTFQSTTSATTLVSSGGSYFTVNLVALNIIQSGPDQGKMYVSLQTNLYAQYGFAANNSLVTTTGSNLTLSGSPSTGIQASPAVQTFIWTSQNVQSVYDGTYTFQWVTYLCPGPSNLSACVPDRVTTYKVLIYLRAQATSSSKVTLGSIITIFNDNTFTTPQSSVFTEGFPICFKDSLQVSLADINVFSTSIYNAYLCGPPPNSNTLSFDGITNFGCKNSTSVARLVVNGSVLAGSIGPSIIGYYNPVLYNMPNSIDTGLCINAQARIMDNNGVFYDSPLQFIHIELSISILGQNVIRNSVLKYVNHIPSSMTNAVMDPVESSSMEESRNDSVDNTEDNNSNTNNNDNPINNDNQEEQDPTPTENPSPNTEPSSSRQASSSTNSFRVQRLAHSNPTPSPTPTPCAPNHNEPHHHHHNHNTSNYDNSTINATLFCQAWLKDYNPHFFHFHRFLSLFIVIVVMFIMLLLGSALGDIKRRDTEDLYLRNK